MRKRKHIKHIIPEKQCEGKKMIIHDDPSIQDAVSKLIFPVHFFTTRKALVDEFKRLTGLDMPDDGSDSVQNDSKGREYFPACASMISIPQRQIHLIRYILPRNKISREFIVGAIIHEVTHAYFGETISPIFSTSMPIGKLINSIYGDIDKFLARLPNRVTIDQEIAIYWINKSMENLNMCIDWYVNAHCWKYYPSTHVFIARLSNDAILISNTTYTDLEKGYFRNLQHFTDGLYEGIFRKFDPFCPTLDNLRTLANHALDQKILELGTA